MKNSIFFFALLCLAIFTTCGDDDFKGKACFTFSPESTIKVGDVVTFTNCSNDAGHFLWNFGDGSTSIAKEPTHSYTAAGAYKITLVVQDSELTDLNADMTINELDRLTGSSDLVTETITVVTE